MPDEIFNVHDKALRLANVELNPYLA